MFYFYILTKPIWIYVCHWRIKLFIYIINILFNIIKGTFKVKTQKIGQKSASWPKLRREQNPPIKYVFKIYIMKRYV